MGKDQALNQAWATVPVCARAQGSHPQSPSSPTSTCPRGPGRLCFPGGAASGTGSVAALPCRCSSPCWLQRCRCQIQDGHWTNPPAAPRAGTRAPAPCSQVSFRHRMQKHFPLVPLFSSGGLISSCNLYSNFQPAGMVSSPVPTPIPLLHWTVGRQAPVLGVGNPNNWVLVPS